MEEELQWVAHHWVGNSFVHQFKSLVFAVMVDHIWKARNMDLFKAKPATAVGIMLGIVDKVHHVVLGWGNMPKTQ